MSAPQGPADDRFDTSYKAGMTLPLPLIEAISALTATAAESAAAAVLFDFASALAATVCTKMAWVKRHAQNMASVAWHKASAHQHLLQSF
jgi:hypothetical protein